MEYLPEELIILLGSKLDYLSVLKWCASTPKFRQICQGYKFWQFKSIYDFGSSWTEFNKFFEQLNFNGQETYIRLAGKYNKPIPGAERYGNMTRLVKAAAMSQDFFIIKYFYNLSQDSTIFRYLAIKNKAQFIQELIGDHHDLLSGKIAREILLGAAEAGNWDLIKLVIDKVNRQDVHNALPYSADSGDLSLIKYLWDLGGQMPSWGQILSIAAVHKYSDIIDYAISMGADYEDAIISAASANDWPTVEKLINLSNIEEDDLLDYQLIGAALGGNRQMVNQLLEKGATDIDNALDGAVQGHHIDIVEDLLKKVVDNDTISFQDHIRVGIDDINIVKLLINYVSTINKTTMYAAIDSGDGEIFSILYDKYRGSKIDLFYRAAERGELEIIQAWLTKNESIQSNEINTGIEIAITAFNLNIVNYLLHYKANQISDIWRQHHRPQLATEMARLFKY